MEPWMIFAPLAVLWMVSAGLGAWVAAQKERDGNEGLWLGLLFGPFGVLIEALLPTGEPAPPRAAGPPKAPPPPKRWEMPLRPLGPEDQP